MSGSPPYYGKYRGTVVNNVDPYQMGRLQVSCSAVLVDGQLSWALPSVPYAGPGVGFFFIPPNGANIWVEFEGGSTKSPIWSGCFWDHGQAPTSPEGTPAVAEKKVLKTATTTITISDLPGLEGLTIETQAGMKITLSALGLEITNGQGAVIKLAGPQVSVNNGALEVV